jgi:hypothetical protein
MSMYKTTIVIWSDYDPSKSDIDTLARDSISGQSYCSVRKSEHIQNHRSDNDWDGTEFFDEPGEVVL